MDKLRIMKFTAFARKHLEEEIGNIESISSNHVKDYAGKWFVLYIVSKYMEINKISVEEKPFSSEMKIYDKYKLINEAMGYIIPDNKFSDYYPSESFDKGIIDKCFDKLISYECFGETEIIGWMYQYYMSDEKDRVFKGLQDNVKVSKEDIPYATQLFTPKWIGQYLVQNSLGRKLSYIGLSELQKDWKYYIKDKDIESDKEYGDFCIENIRFLDPCMGTGNILLEAFDIFYKAYEYLGYDSKDIAGLIFRNNLYGLDIDDTAVNIGKLCLVLKSSLYNGNYFCSSYLNLLDDKMTAIKDSNGLLDEAEHVAVDIDAKKSLQYLVKKFENGAEYGSIISVDRNKSQSALSLVNENISMSYECRSMIVAADILSAGYDVIATNPPYLGIRGINDRFADYLSINYPLSKYDLCTVYMERAYSLLKEEGIYAMINQHSWMFLTSFEKLREKMLKEWYFISLLHLGSKAFEENVGTIVQNAAFVVEKTNGKRESTTAIDLRKGGCFEKEQVLFDILHGKSASGVYKCDMDSFLSIPRKPFAYWIDESVLNIFKRCMPLDKEARPRQGMATSDNQRFVRYWYEVDMRDICFDAKDKKEAFESGKRWFPYRKGGRFRKWFGNNSFIINWQDDGREVKEYAASLYKTYTRTIKNEDLYFKKCLTYTFISEDLGIRYSDSGFIFDVAGSSIFIDDDRKEKVILGFLCSSTANYFLEVMNPTYNIQVGDLKNIPVDEKMFSDCYAERIIPLVEENIALSREEWDDFEESWNFTCHPYIKYRKKQDSTLYECSRSWEEYASDRFEKVKRNEEELGRIFAEIYGLDGKVPADIEDDMITMRRADIKSDAQSFLSFVCGCIFGRFKCEGYESGLSNNISVISNGGCRNDFYSMIEDFLSSVFGAEHLQQNLKFIADALEAWKDKTPEERIRRYIKTSFYKDHLKSYNGRPVYWLFSSGKNKAFEAMTYYHNYSVSEPYIIVSEYLDGVQRFYEDRIKSAIAEVKSSGKNITKAQHQRIVEYNDCLMEINEYRDKLKRKAEEAMVFDYNNGIEANYKRYQGSNPVLKDITKKKYIE